LVCYSGFKAHGMQTPVFFQCGHSICKKCSEQLHEPCPISFSASRKKVRCPSCFGYSPYPLIKNFELINLIDSNTDPLSKTCPTFSKDMCQNCTRTEAVVYCVNCVISFCRTCDNLIHCSVAMKRHNRGEIVTNFTGDASTLNSQQLCPLHAGEKLKLYCSSCNLLVCRDCADFGSHRGHTLTLISRSALLYRQVTSSPSLMSSTHTDC
jgi:hypothetical protein